MFDFENLEFSDRDNNNELYIPKEQLVDIVNIGKTCLYLDGIKGSRGVLPEVTLFDPIFPQLGKGMSKSSLPTIMITGINAAGEAIPPHFQFQTKAQTEETQQMRNELIEFMLYVRGKF